MVSCLCRIEPVEGRGPEHVRRHAFAAAFRAFRPGEQPEVVRAGEVIKQLFARAGVVGDVAGAVPPVTVPALVYRSRSAQ